MKQDTFEDLDEEAKELLAARMADEKIKETVASALTSSEASILNSATMGAPVSTTNSPGALVPSLGAMGNSRPQGMLASQLERSFPSLLDPTSKTFVWGAPPVDRIGRLGDKNDRPT